jgi:uncharacterized protein (DUF58 family)
VLLVASINYQLNLGYLLTFLLAGSAVVGMHVCHGTLRGLTMQLHSARPGLCRGSSATLASTCATRRRTARHGIGLAVLGAPRPLGWTDVPGQGSATVQVAFQPSAGPATLPPLTAETRFPLGTFRVWTVWRPAPGCWSTPRPSPAPAAAAG